MTVCTGIAPVIEYRIAGWMQKALKRSGCKEVKVTVPESIITNKRETIFECK